MIQIHDLLVLSQPRFVDRQVRAALAAGDRKPGFRLLIARLRARRG